MESNGLTPDIGNKAGNVLWKLDMEVQEEREIPAISQAPD